MLTVFVYKNGAWSEAIKRYFSAEEIRINQMYSFATGMAT